jgi:hypothetical protein
VPLRLRPAPAGRIWIPSTKSASPGPRTEDDLCLALLAFSSLSSTLMTLDTLDTLSALSSLLPSPSGLGGTVLYQDRRSAFLVSDRAPPSPRGLRACQHSVRDTEQASAPMTTFLLVTFRRLQGKNVYKSVAQGLKTLVAGPFDECAQVQRFVVGQSWRCLV